MRKRVNALIADRTGQTYDKVVSDTERNFWMSAEEAVAYGLAGKIIQRADEA